MRLNTDDYFDQLYQDNDDTWHYQQRWYEQRKRQLCLAALRGTGSVSRQAA